MSAITNEIFIGGISYDVGMDQAIQYLERAKALEPDAELVLVAAGGCARFPGEGLDYRRTRSELKVVSQRLIELYPNDPEGYFRLGVVGRQEGRYDEAAQYIAKDDPTQSAKPFDQKPSIGTWPTAAYWRDTRSGGTGLG